MIRVMIQQVLVHYSIVSDLRPICSRDINPGTQQITDEFIRNVLSTEYYPDQLKRKYILPEYKDKEARNMRK